MVELAPFLTGFYILERGFYTRLGSLVELTLVVWSVWAERRRAGPEGLRVRELAPPLAWAVLES